MILPLRALVLACIALVASGGALAQPAQAPFSVPAPQTMPDGPLGDAVKQGLSIMNATKAALPANVGNGLNCSSCHLNAGTVPHASPFVGLWGVFPAYETRSASVETLADRINDCFRRSMNGKALDVDSAPMRAMLAYIAWLSTGVPTGTSVEGRGFRGGGGAARCAGRGSRRDAVRAALRRLPRPGRRRDAQRGRELLDAAGVGAGLVQRRRGHDARRDLGGVHQGEDAARARRHALRPGCVGHRGADFRGAAAGVRSRRAGDRRRARRRRQWAGFSRRGAREPG